MTKPAFTSEAPKVLRAIKFGPEASDNLTPDQHTKLVNHLFKLLKRDENRLSQRRGDMRAIESDLLGLVLPEGTDTERRQKRDEGTSVSVPDAIYPFGWFTLQQFTSELMAIVMPVEAPYAVVTGAAQQGMADKITRGFRHQGVLFDHRNNVQAAMFDTLALDCGVLFYEWDKIASPAVDKSLAGVLSVNPLETAGLNMRHADPYNVSWDPHVTVKNLARHGEFVAEFAPQSPFSLRRDVFRGKCFLDDDMLAALENECASDVRTENFGPAVQKGGMGAYWRYYTPEISKSRALAHQAWGTRVAQVDFTGLFTEVNSAVTDNRDLVHVTRMLVRLRPSEWGLANRGLGKRAGKDAPFEIWEIRMVGPGIISYAAPVSTKVDLLPVSVASMNFNKAPGRSFRFGDHAAQLGLLASTILNMTKRAMRKGLEGGVTVYNSKVIPLERLDDMSGGRLPANMMRHDDDLRRHVMQLSDTPDVNGRIGDAVALQDLLKSIFPTNSQPAMAGLDRATTYQAQAVLMTGMRSLIYYATLVDGQILVPSRFHLQHQNLLNRTALNYVDERTQQALEVSAQEMEASQFMLVQAQPLIGIDRLRASSELRDLLNVVMASGGQIPPLARYILNHHMQLAGMPLDPEDFNEAIREQSEYEAQMQQAQQAASNRPGAPGSSAVGGRPPVEL